MILYHGSNIAIPHPCLVKSRRLLDLGCGFYLTSDLEQARKWAEHAARLRKDGTPSVSCYDFQANPSLKSLSFSSADRNWLHLVADNRLGKDVGGEYDLIVGPVANDQVIRTVQDFISGYFSEDIAIRILETQKLKDQYAFKTEQALRCLQYREVLL